MSDDDRRLIAECLGGRREAFSELVSRYQARLYNAAVRLVDNPDDAADVVQDDASRGVHNPAFSLEVLSNTFNHVSQLLK